MPRLRTAKQKYDDLVEAEATLRAEKVAAKKKKKRSRPRIKGLVPKKQRLSTVEEEDKESKRDSNSSSSSSSKTLFVSDSKDESLDIGNSTSVPTNERND